MGVPSPFIGAAVSPALGGRSKQGTPELPRLSSFDELGTLEGFSLCPPHYEDTIEQKARLSSWDEAAVAPQAVWDQAAAIPEATLTQQQWSRAQEQPVPEWPSHLPTYKHKVTEMNTFLEIQSPSPYIGAEPPRRRAGSDFTGMRELERADFDVSIEDLLEPLPPPASEAPQETSPEQQWCWMVQDPVNGAWMMMCGNPDGSQMWPAPAQQQDCSQAWSAPPVDAPCLPPQPPADKAFKPKWVYGSTWPFNCAPTTLILDNLPWDLTQPELLAVLDASGFRGLYDFVFLPSSLRTGRNQGNAIVNLTRHSHGLALAARAQGFANWGPSADGNRCEVSWSLPLQGIGEHIDNYRNHPAMHESVPEAFRPSLFVNGWQVPFPAPTERIRAPRLGHR